MNAGQQIFHILTEAKRSKADTAIELNSVIAPNFSWWLEFKDGEYQLFVICSEGSDGAYEIMEYCEDPDQQIDIEWNQSRYVGVWVDSFPNETVMLDALIDAIDYRDKHGYELN